MDFHYDKTTERGINKWFGQIRNTVISIWSTDIPSVNIMIVKCTGSTST
jgi:hypothetical protein